MSEIKKLYEVYKKLLESDTSVMRDDILFLLIRIEKEIQGVLGTTEVSEKRGNHYKLADQPNPQFHTKIAKEAQIMHDNIGIGLSIQHMLGQIVRRQNQIKSLLSDASYEAICRHLGIVYQIHSDGKMRPFVPTDTHGRSPQIGSGNGWEAEKCQPKFLEFISILQTIQTPEGGCIDTQDIRVDFQSDTPDTMVRTLPYVVIRIPRLNRTILIDDRIGEATFVFQGILDLDIVRSESKMGLQTYHGAKQIVYNQYWGDSLREYLSQDWEAENGEVKLEKNIPKSRINIDRASLFMDNEFIRDTLESFAKEGNTPITELSISTPKENTKISLSSGMEMTWNTFLTNASKYLLETSHTKENPPKKAEALDLLCERGGIVRLDKKYFSNSIFLEKDLESFSQKGNISLAQLSTQTPKWSTKIILSNGIEITWATFLINASKYLLETKAGGKNPHKKAEALDLLCERVGVIRLNEKYFTNSAYMLSDLESFAQKLNIPLAKLSTQRLKRNTKTVLSNGVEMTWNTFLTNASKYLLRTSRTKGNPNSQAEILDLLCERVGVIRLDEKYFTNSACILSDLERFTKEGNISLAELSTSTPKPNTKIILSNGMEITWNTFLNNASRYLLETNSRNENPHRPSKALDLLCEQIGIVRITKKSK